MKRSGFLSASATMVAAVTAPSLVDAQTSIPGGSARVEMHANFDEAAFAQLLGRPADIRQVFEAVAFNATLLNNVKNALNGFQFGFGYGADRIAIALAGHGPSAAYGYSDYLWQKYRIGEFFNIKDASGTAIGSNAWYAAKSSFTPGTNPNDDGGMYQDASLQMLQKRGVVVLTCHTAVEEQSRNLVAKGYAPGGMSAQDVANDILTHLIPGAVVVPAMVSTVAVLQAKYKYTYAALAF